MTHEMKLDLVPFEQIKAGTKTIEIRLNDERRQLLNVGDEITFSLMADQGQKVSVRVLELLHFNSFKDLFEALPPERDGAVSKEYKDMYKYYSEEDEDKYGVLGIRFIKL
ncbi:MAG: ASCH domain-containing protein [Parcubacteria group bacterium]